MHTVAVYGCLRCSVCTVNSPSIAAPAGMAARRKRLLRAKAARAPAAASGVCAHPLRRRCSAPGAAHMGFARPRTRLAGTTCASMPRRGGALVPRSVPRSAPTTPNPRGALSCPGPERDGRIWRTGSLMRGPMGRPCTPPWLHAAVHTLRHGGRGTPFAPPHRPCYAPPPHAPPTTPRSPPSSTPFLTPPLPTSHPTPSPTPSKKPLLRPSRPGAVPLLRRRPAGCVPRHERALQVWPRLLEVPLRQPRRHDRLALRLGRVVQEGVGAARAG